MLLRRESRVHMISRSDSDSEAISLTKKRETKTGMEVL